MQSKSEMLKHIVAFISFTFKYLFCLLCLLLNNFACFVLNVSIFLSFMKHVVSQLNKVYQFIVLFSYNTVITIDQPIVRDAMHTHKCFHLI